MSEADFERDTDVEDEKSEYTYYDEVVTDEEAMKEQSNNDLSEALKDDDDSDSDFGGYMPSIVSKTKPSPEKKDKPKKAKLTKTIKAKKKKTTTKKPPKARVGSPNINVPSRGPPLLTDQRKSHTMSADQSPYMQISNPSGSIPGLGVGMQGTFSNPNSSLP